MLRVKINLFGAFRNFSKYFDNKDHVEFFFENPCDVKQIRLAFNNLLTANIPDFDELLLVQSVFADEEQILPETTQFNRSVDLIILPPISGG
jgi:hypothetical protein